MTADSPHEGSLGIFVVPPATDDPGRTYDDVLRAIRTAEELGFSTAWLSEAHFSPHIGLPAALSLLAAASQHTDRIRLGTAVLPLAFDHPYRVAETASLVNTLTGDRLELGVGKGNPFGFSTSAYTAFGLDEGDRDTLFARALDALRLGLDGTVPAGAEDVSLYPPAQGLPRRLWQATGAHRTAAAAGASGDGLLLYRTSPEGVAGDVQSLLIDSYLGSFDRSAAEPRVGISRGVLPAASREAALAVAEEDLRRREHATLPGQRTFATVEEYLVDSDIAFGTAEDIVETLSRDRAFVRSTDYLFSLPYAPVGTPEYHAGLRVVADEVFPGLAGRVAPVGGSRLAGIA